MTDKVPAGDIERIVGVQRHETHHYGRAVDGIFYILHSHECLEEYPDLRECDFSLSLDDYGVDPPEDKVLLLYLVNHWITWRVL